MHYCTAMILLPTLGRWCLLRALHHVPGLVIQQLQLAAQSMFLEVDQVCSFLQLWL